MGTTEKTEEMEPPIERLRRRLIEKLDQLEYGLKKVQREQTPDAEWAQLIYEQHINRCQHWLKNIERVG